MNFRTLTILFATVFTLSTGSSYAQTNAVHSRHSKHHKTPPVWAKAKGYNMDAHVYFPDYYSFYDPNRGGYVFWNNNKWTFTPAVPPYMSKIDLSKSRVQILKGLSLDLHPELDYPRYMKLYPADPNSNAADVPVPTPLPIPGAQ
ncbi:MAG TPA: hypothetical protein VN721_13205 [Flavipsychrobacter sp.]|nr:hypothetical protein [Flavipsychrobacter sp.]